MMQNIEGTWVYVVDIEVEPRSLLPIHGLTEEEKRYFDILDTLSTNNGKGLVTRPSDGVYAKALTDAIETEVITAPGKYGIAVRIDHSIEQIDYDIFVIVNPGEPGYVEPTYEGQPILRKV